MMDFEIVLEPFLPFMIRFILGTLFFFQAYDKLFGIGIKQTIATIYTGYREHNIPMWFVQISVWLSACIELIGGMLLILGLFQSIALMLLGINLMMVTIGFSFIKGVWDMQHVFPRLVLLVALFFIPADWDQWSVDYFLNIE